VHTIVSETTSLKLDCRRSLEAAAYLDGELDAHSLVQFEKHLLECRFCAEELRQQRQLLCALEFGLRSTVDNVELPSDFSRIIASSAESDMSGVRTRIEHRRALKLSLALLVAAFVLLGSAALYTSVLIPIKMVVRTFTSFIGFAWYALYNAGVGAAVILRPLGRRLLFELHPISLITLVLFAIAVALLPRMIVRYHRARVTE